MQHNSPASAVTETFRELLLHLDAAALSLTVVRMCQQIFL